MKAKLIKTENDYDLKIDGRTFATTDFKGIHAGANSATEYKLSLKNCQAIENGYDLYTHQIFIQAGKEYLGDNFNMLDIDVDTHQISLIAINKALEILDDKRFSEVDIRKAFLIKHDSISIDYVIQQLQQTQWDVEIEMEYYDPIPPLRETDIRPKLDRDGCLILKRIYIWHK
jgi:hypothetical protein